MRLLLEHCGDNGWSAHVLDYDIVSCGLDVWHAIRMAQEAVHLILEFDADEGLDPRDRASRTPPEAWAAFENTLAKNRRGCRADIEETP